MLISWYNVAIYTNSNIVNI